MKLSKTFWPWAIVGGLILILASVLVVKLFKSEKMPNAPVGLEAASKIITGKYKEYGRNTMLWSGAYHGALCLAALLSAAGGIILKLDSILKDRDALRKDIAAMCAGLAALVLTLSATTDANRKWQSNRVAEYATENLLYEMATTSPSDVKQLYKRLEEIVVRQNEGILGADSKATNETGSH
jgi:hypothetical protein